jgi:hypothetical protein
MAAWYDTHFDNPEVYGGYKGCWGIYPFLPSKLVLASDLTNGIFVLKVDSDLVGNNEMNQDLNQVQFYPNPSNNTISFQGLDQTNGTIKIQIFNLIGECELNLETEEKNQLDISTLKSGVHIIHIKNYNSSFSKKLIKN